MTVNIESPKTTDSKMPLVLIDVRQLNHIHLLIQHIKAGVIDNLWFKAPMFMKTRLLANQFELDLADGMAANRYRPKFNQLSHHFYGALSDLHRYNIPAREHEQWWSIESTVNDRGIERGTGLGFNSPVELDTVIKYDHTHIVPMRVPLQQSDFMHFEVIGELYATIFEKLDMEKHSKLFHLLEEMSASDYTYIASLIYYAASRFWGLSYRDTIANYAMIINTGIYKAYNGDPDTNLIPVEHIHTYDVNPKNWIITMESREAKFAYLFDQSYAFSRYELELMQHWITRSAKTCLDETPKYENFYRTTKQVKTALVKHDLKTAANQYKLSNDVGVKPWHFEISLRYTMDKVIEWVLDGDNLKRLREDKFIDTYTKLVSETGPTKVGHDYQLNW